jgi:hypothetical protein
VGDCRGVRGEGEVVLVFGGVELCERWVVLIPLTFELLAAFSWCGGASSILSSRLAKLFVVEGGGAVGGISFFFFFLSSNFFL